jgi:hypothetical protein
MARQLLTMIISVLMIGTPTLVTAQQAQNSRESETTAQVPALQKFHTPIFTLWHTAWPKQDTAMMAALWPAIEKGVADIAAAELPGILREKKSAWQANLTLLQASAASYKSAMAGNDMQPKLDAAENLHMQYEKMARVIKPVLKELEAFHAVLYMVYHYYLPEHRMDKLKSAAMELRAKMDTLNAAKLPDRLAAKNATFQIARSKLSASVDVVHAVMASNDEKKIAAAIQTMHGDYEALEKVFE